MGEVDWESFSDDDEAESVFESEWRQLEEFREVSDTHIGTESLNQDLLERVKEVKEQQEGEQ